MSPWYTGKQHGKVLGADRVTLQYRADDPDVLASFAIRIFRNQAIIHVRDHRTRLWLARWVAPF
jgi:hypothetical protein